MTKEIVTTVNWELHELLLHPEHSEKPVDEELSYHTIMSNHHFSKFILFGQRIVHSHTWCFQIAGFTHANMWSDKSNLEEKYMVIFSIVYNVIVLDILGHTLSKFCSLNWWKLTSDTLCSHHKMYIKTESHSWFANLQNNLLSSSSCPSVCMHQ
jgi:hypothetical protein